MFIITGAPRTGTTYIQQYLNQDKNTCVLHECGYLVSTKKRLPYLYDDEYFNQVINDKGITFNHIENHFYDLHNHISLDVFGDKYPYYSEKLDIVKLKIPDIKVIFCVRHPIDSINSMVNNLGWSYHKAYLTLCNSYNGFFQEKHNLKYMIMKYEYYVNDEPQLKKDLSDFLKYKFDFEDKITESYDRPIGQNKLLEKTLLDNEFIRFIMKEFKYES